VEASYKAGLERERKNAFIVLGLGEIFFVAVLIFFLPLVNWV
jgi:hypothetical protein